jgi:hypothetical protein
MFSHRHLKRLIMSGKVSGFYSKSVWSKVGTLTVYMLISCILMPENCFRSGKITKCTPYSQCFQGLRYLFNILKLNNAIYMPRVPSLFY